ncbi:DUF1127 domain-containing protein [Roseobacter sinensis]|uniref:DUF1127 domain-containing protein n=1 Tax=Roseobacter sinensis TaxID=2931391 RepID=A0ABT3BHD7_9RHOB|nr:DUF1127 domain-containing protein [Roseobacter sp. WL0113]MCV3272992.1 DUF1127 domain-containing protein [Roseobacter sp. WL0113]
MSLIDTVTYRRAAALPRRHFRLGTYLSLWRSRRALARLDARALEDIGVDSEAAQFEARRGFWDVPETWRNS